MSLINGKDEMTKNHDYLNVLFDSAFLVVIVTSCLYLFGYGYYKSFFDGLSIPTKFLEISPVHYFIKSFDVIIIFSIVFTIALLLYSMMTPFSVDVNTSLNPLANERSAFKGRSTLHFGPLIPARLHRVPDFIAPVRITTRFPGSKDPVSPFAGARHPPRGR